MQVQKLTIFATNLFKSFKILTQNSIEEIEPVVTVEHEFENERSKNPKFYAKIKVLKTQKKNPPQL